MELVAVITLTLVSTVNIKALAIVPARVQLKVTVTVWFLRIFTEFLEVVGVNTGANLTSVSLKG